MKPFEEDAAEENGKFRPAESLHFQIVGGTDRSMRWLVSVEPFLGAIEPAYEAVFDHRNDTESVDVVGHERVD